MLEKCEEVILRSGVRDMERSKREKADKEKADKQRAEKQRAEKQKAKEVQIGLAPCTRERLMKDNMDEIKESLVRAAEIMDNMRNDWSKQELGLDKKGSHPLGYAKMQPMVMVAVSKQTTAEPVAVKSLAVGIVESAVQPAQPTQPTQSRWHCELPIADNPPYIAVNPSYIWELPKRESKNEKVEQKAAEHQVDQHQEQDEAESEYEVVNIEKENGDDWIVVGDDAF